MVAARPDAPAIITKTSSKSKEPPAKSKSSSGGGSTKRSGTQNVTNGQRTGFDEGLTAQKIIGATDTDGRLMYLIKW